MTKKRDSVLPKFSIGIKLLPGSPLPRPEGTERYGRRSAVPVQESGEAEASQPPAQRGGWIFVRTSETED
jgi:hypothetical protein